MDESVNLLRIITTLYLGCLSLWWFDIESNSKTTDSISKWTATIKKINVILSRKMKNQILLEIILSRKLLTQRAYIFYSYQWREWGQFVLIWFVVVVKLKSYFIQYIFPHEISPVNDYVTLTNSYSHINNAEPLSEQKTWSIEKRLQGNYLDFLILCALLLSFWCFWCFCVRYMSFVLPMRDRKRMNVSMSRRHSFQK